MLVFFFQAEDGIRDLYVTGVQTCALPICLLVCVAPLVDDAEVRQFLQNAAAGGAAMVERRFRDGISAGEIRSEERRVGKECRYRWGRDHQKKKKQQMNKY